MTSYFTTRGTPWTNWLLICLVADHSLTPEGHIMARPSIDFEQFIARLSIFGPSSQAQRRRLQLHPTLSTIRLSFRELMGQGRVVRREDTALLHFAEDVLRIAPAIGGFLTRWDLLDRRALQSISIEDHVEQIADAELANLIHTQAALQMGERVAHLVAVCDSPRDRELALLALAQLPDLHHSVLDGLLAQA